MRKKALEGIRVLEYSSLISGPYASKLLADLGAEIIKIEAPGKGDGSRSHGPFADGDVGEGRGGLFLWLNANKSGITLDIQTATGKAIFEKLAGSADVLIEDTPRDTLDRLGLGYEHLRDINQRLVMTSVTPFGKTGPHKDFKAYAINCCAAGGASVGTGDAGREPIAMPFSMGSFEAGANAAIATLHALLMRDVIGRGQHVDVSEAEVLATLLTGRYMLLFIFGGVTGIRRGRHAGYFLYPVTVLPCKDGYMCLIAPQIEQWTRFTELMGSPDWTKDPKYRNRRAMAEQYPHEADALLLPWFASRTKEEIFSLCRRYRIPFAPVRTMDEIARDSHLKAREFFLDVEQLGVGRVPYLGFPYKLSGTACSMERPAPGMGEHNEAILCHRLGYSKAELAQLRRTGIV